MPGWLIDLFGSRQVEEAFLALTLAPLPIWVSLAFFPNRKWTQWIASPFLAPPLLSLAYLYFVWKLWDIGAPDAPDPMARSVRGYIYHPLVFLVLWAHLQMANLFVGTVLAADARRRGLSVRVELALCWIFAPVAVLLYTVRRWFRRTLKIPI